MCLCCTAELVLSFIQNFIVLEKNAVTVLEMCLLISKNSFAEFGPAAHTRPALMLTQDSPYGSLTPHIPNQSQLPGASDSSDGEEQEFMQGLVFDATRRGASLHASYPPDPYASYAPDSFSLSSQPESVPYDTGSSGRDSNAAMQNLASSLLQYSQAGGESAGALLSSLGQTVLTSVMSNMAAAAQQQQQQPHPATATRSRRAELSDDLSEPDSAQQATARRVRRRAKRPASAVTNYLVEEATESEDNRNNGDFEIISDDEMSE